MEAKEQEKNASGANNNKRKSVVDLLKKSGDKSPAAKRAKTSGYELEPELLELINKDQLNAKLWEECKESLGDTKQVLYKYHNFSLSFSCLNKFILLYK